MRRDAIVLNAGPEGCVAIRGGADVVFARKRAREMALRVAIGAGRMRLVQLVIVESAWVAFLAAAFGGLFAWWAAPFVVGRELRANVALR